VLLPPPAGTGLFGGAKHQPFQKIMPLCGQGLFRFPPHLDLTRSRDLIGGPPWRSRSCLSNVRFPDDSFRLAATPVPSYC